MRTKPSKKLHTIVLEYHNGITRTVQVKAATRDVAERRALKRNPAAKGVKAP